MPVNPQAFNIAQSFMRPTQSYARQGTPAKRRQVGLPVEPRTRMPQNQVLADYARKIGINRYG